MARPIRRDGDRAVDREASRLVPIVDGHELYGKIGSVQHSVQHGRPYVLIDTQDDVWEPLLVLKTKRTYNLSRRTIETVQTLVLERHVAPTQDALVELAVDELARHVRDGDEAQAWAAAANDPEFAAESDALEGDYRTADAETWPRA